VNHRLRHKDSDDYNSVCATHRVGPSRHSRPTRWATPAPGDEAIRSHRALPQVPARGRRDSVHAEAVDGRAATHRGFVDVLLGTVGDVEAPGAVAEGRDPELRVPASLQHPGAQLERRRMAFRRRRCSGQAWRPRDGRAVPPDGARCSISMLTSAPMSWAVLLMMSQRPPVVAGHNFFAQQRAGRPIGRGKPCARAAWSGLPAGLHRRHAELNPAIRLRRCARSSLCAHATRAIRCGEPAGQ
jgi:hypothetical protein